MSAPPPQSLLDALERACGHVRVLRDCSHAHGEAAVWELELEGVLAYLKRHRQRRKFVQEREAYEVLGAALGRRVPRLLWHEERAHAMVTIGVPGVVAESVRWSPAERKEIVAQAGAFRRDLSSLKWDDGDAMRVDQALERRLEEWIARGRHVLDTRTIEFGRASWRERATLFADTTRRFCHRDFSPRNFVVNRTPGGELELAVIDFGHARGDVPLVDRLKLWDGWWVEDPALEHAFGPRLDADDAARFEFLALLHGMATVVWSVDHGDAEYEARGREVLGRLVGRGR